LPLEGLGIFNLEELGKKFCSKLLRNGIIELITIFMHTNLGEEFMQKKRAFSKDLRCYITFNFVILVMQKGNLVIFLKLWDEI